MCPATSQNLLPLSTRLPNDIFPSGQTYKKDGTTEFFSDAFPTYVSGHSKKKEVSQYYDVPTHSHFNANRSSYIIGISRTQ